MYATWSKYWREFFSAIAESWKKAEDFKVFVVYCAIKSKWISSCLVFAAFSATKIGLLATLLKGRTGTEKNKESNFSN